MKLESVNIMNSNLGVLQYKTYELMQNINLSIEKSFYSSGPYSSTTAKYEKQYRKLSRHYDMLMSQRHQLELAKKYMNDNNLLEIQ